MVDPNNTDCQQNHIPCADRRCCRTTEQPINPEAGQRPAIQHSAMHSQSINHAHNQDSNCINLQTLNTPYHKNDSLSCLVAIYLYLFDSCGVIAFTVPGGVMTAPHSKNRCSARMPSSLTTTTTSTTSTSNFGWIRLAAARNRIC